MKSTFYIVAFLALSLSLTAQDATTEEPQLTDEQYEAIIDSIEQSINYQYGKVELVDGHAYIDVPKGYKFINGEQAAYVLSDLWGNPPSDVLPEGMLIPEEVGVLSENFTYAIEMTYSDDGYIDDKDAKEIDSDELLDGMKEDSKAENEYRKEQGYPTVNIVGWASEPYYDEAAKKLHWAKELNFGGEETNTLNYNIRVLGRKGFINLNAIGDMGLLNQVKRKVPEVLDAVHFNEGYAYGDFTPGVDKVAAYGISGLIAGKILAKAGLLAKAGIFLAKFWKLIAVAIVGFFAFLKRFVTGKSEEDNTKTPQA